MESVWSCVMWLKPNINIASCLPIDWCRWGEQRSLSLSHLYYDSRLSSTSRGAQSKQLLIGLLWLPAATQGLSCCHGSSMGTVTASHSDGFIGRRGQSLNRWPSLWGAMGIFFPPFYCKIEWVSITSVSVYGGRFLILFDEDQSDVKGFESQWNGVWFLLCAPVASRQILNNLMSIRFVAV